MGERAVSDPAAEELIAAALEQEEVRGILQRLDGRERELLAARLREALLRKLGAMRDEERQLLELTAAMSTELKLHPLLVKIMQTVTRLLGAERATLFLHDAASGELWALAGQGEELSQIRFPARAGIAGHVFTTGETINIEDAYADARFNPELDRRTGFRTRSILCMPVIAPSGETVAVTQVLNKRGGPFSELDERRLRAFSAQASVALDRAQLFEAFLEKERIESSLKLAHDIQMGMLPRVVPQDGRLDLCATLRPARSVGGDLYDYFVEADRLFFLIGDVSGKGVGAALFMAVAKALLRATVQAEPALAAALAKVNRELCRDNERAMFVTLFAGWLDLASGEVVYVNAGHNRPYLLAADGTVRAVHGGHGVALAVLPDYEFETAKLRLEPGEALFLYTDGVVEAHDASLQAYGAGRLEALLAEARRRSTADLVGGLLASVTGFSHGTRQFDDITVLALRYLGAAA